MTSIKVPKYYLAFSTMNNLEENITPEEQTRMLEAIEQYWRDVLERKLPEGVTFVNIVLNPSEIMRGPEAGDGFELRYDFDSEVEVSGEITPSDLFTVMAQTDSVSGLSEMLTKFLFPLGEPFENNIATVKIEALEGLS